MTCRCLRPETSSTEGEAEKHPRLVWRLRPTGRDPKGLHFWPLGCQPRIPLPGDSRDCSTRAGTPGLGPAVQDPLGPRGHTTGVHPRLRGPETPSGPVPVGWLHIHTGPVGSRPSALTEDTDRFLPPAPSTPGGVGSQLLLGDGASTLTDRTGCRGVDSSWEAVRTGHQESPSLPSVPLTTCSIPRAVSCRHCFPRGLSS